MARTPVKHTDLVTAIVAALNGSTCNGGTLKATANGQDVQVYAHNDAVNGSYNSTFCVKVS